jgi:hypothetical protein
LEINFLSDIFVSNDIFKILSTMIQILPDVIREVNHLCILEEPGALTGGPSEGFMLTGKAIRKAGGMPLIRDGCLECDRNPWCNPIFIALGDALLGLINYRVLTESAVMEGFLTPQYALVAGD